MPRYLALSLVFVLATTISMGAGAAPPLKDLVRRAEFTGASLSPDGRHLAVATPA
jgi:hypothetical protein